MIDPTDVQFLLGLAGIVCGGLFWIAVILNS